MHLVAWTSDNKMPSIISPKSTWTFNENDVLEIKQNYKNNIGENKWITRSAFGPDQRCFQYRSSMICKVIIIFHPTTDASAKTYVFPSSLLVVNLIEVPATVHSDRCGHRDVQRGNGAFASIRVRHCFAVLVSPYVIPRPFKMMASHLLRERHFLRSG